MYVSWVGVWACVCLYVGVCVCDSSGIDMVLVLAEILQTRYIQK